MLDDIVTSNCSCLSSTVLDMTSLYMDRVALPLVGLVGLAGNVVAIGIICRERRSTFQHSLITLAIIEELTTHLSRRMEKI